MHDVVTLHDHKGSCSVCVYFIPQDGLIQFVIGKWLYRFKMNSSPKTYDVIIVGGELLYAAISLTCTMRC